MPLGEAIAWILATAGHIFSVEVRKRDGQIRAMNCRLNVKKHLAGGERSYDPNQHNLIWVFDMQAQGYRSIACEGLLRVKINGKWVEVTHPQDSNQITEDSEHGTGGSPWSNTHGDDLNLP